jgi:tripartite-type tricarboxylate transporter receptor subunit TctC
MDFTGISQTQPIDRPARHWWALWRCAGLVLCIATLLFSGCTKPSQFPSRPITIICPWSAGGGTDRVARQIAIELESELGVPVNVINATGGGGVTGHTRGAQARGDGYTLSMITVELSMLHWRGLTNLTHRDFAPLQLLNRDAAALFVRGDSTYQTIDDLRGAIAASRKTLKASGTAYGGIWHIAIAGWLDSQGLAADDATWISINGAGPSIQELLAGGVDFICCSLPEADAVVSGGQVRCLGVMANRRVAGFENVPTFAEQGHDWSIAGWRGLAAPVDTPREALETLRQAIQTVTQGDSFKDFMAASGFDMSLENADQFASTLQQQDDLFGSILTQPAFQAVSGEQFGPMMFPALIAAGIVILSVVLARDSLAHSREQAPLVQAEMEPDESTGRGKPIAILAALIFYWFASEPLGFILAAFLMLFGTLILLKVPRLTAVAVALAASLATYQLFAILLRVPLPRGFLEW